MGGPEVTEVEAAVVRRRMLSMRELLDHLAAVDPVTAEQLRGDIGLRLQVTMALAQLVTLATETNAHVLSRRTGRPPADARTSFTDMAGIGWIDPDLAAALRDSPGMRNIIVHEYVRLDLDIVSGAVPVAVRRYRDYVRQVAAKLPES